MRIFADLTFSSLPNQLDTDLKSEGRWCANWARLLGPHVDDIHACNCDDRPKGKYDIALLPHGLIPHDIDADLYIFMYFSPQTMLDNEHDESHRDIHRRNNTIIVYPVDKQFHRSGEPDNPYGYKTYFMPTPVADHCNEPDYELHNSIAWTCRYGPRHSDEMYFQAFLKYCKLHDLNVRLLSYQNFCQFITESEGDAGANILRSLVDELHSVDKINSLPWNALNDMLQHTKFAFNYGDVGLTGSMFEIVTSGSFPLVGPGTRQLFSEIDLHLYADPYPNNINGIIDNWNIPLNDNKFYSHAVKQYQQDIKPHLYANALKQFSDIIEKYGYKLDR